MTSSSTQQKDLKHVAIGGLVNMLNILGALAVPALHGLIVWAYGPIVYGLYATGSAVAEVASKLGTLGADKGLLRAVPAHKVDQNDRAVSDSLWTAFLTALVMSGLLATGVYFLADYLAPYFGGARYRDSIAWLAPTITFFALTNVFVAATLSAKLARFNLLVRGIIQPVSVLLLTAVFAFKPSLESLALASITALLLTSVVGLWTVMKVFRPKFRFTFQTDLVKFSAPLGISEFLNNLTHRASLLILAFYVSPQEMAAYAACDMLVRAVAGVRNAFDPILAPLLSEALQEKNVPRVSYNLKLTTRWVIALAIPVISAFFLFGHDILELINPQFKDAAMILTVLSLGYAINAGLGLNGWVLTMAGHSWILLFNNVISSLTNIALAVTLIPSMGILGAAISTSTGVVMMIFLIFVEVAWMKRIQPLSWATARVILIGCACLILLLWISPRLPESGLTRILIGMSFFIMIYLVLFRLLAFEEEDRLLLNKVLRRNSSK